MGREHLSPTDRPALVPDGDDSGVAVSFAVGPSGVGPVMGFGSDDFFPVAPVADAVTAAEDEPVRGANERRGS
jgi:hypothetical protein